jgi:hypothetical protein
VFSGSVTSTQVVVQLPPGFGTREDPPLVACYTGPAKKEDGALLVSGTAPNYSETWCFLNEGQSGQLLLQMVNTTPGHVYRFVVVR